MMKTNHPSRRRWVPGPRLYIGLTALALVAFGLALGASYFGWHSALDVGNAVLIAALLLASADYVGSRKLAPVVITRNVPSTLAVDKWASVQLQISHQFTKPTSIQLFDGIPATVEQDDLPLALRLAPGQTQSITYTLRPLERGSLELGLCHVQIPSPLGLWVINYRCGAAQTIKVFPDFKAITAYTILATDNHTSQIGIKRKPRRGSGLEFQQLREYRRGDSLRQLDWKATARRQTLISRDYQEERDQQIVLMVDSGRRMRAQDDDLSHFDHALNATLLVGYIALRQGDSVSVMSFGESLRWIPPQKGAERIKNLLEGMYDLQATPCAPDYTIAAETLSSLQQKRSLVILVTNSRDEDVDELLLAVNLLKRRHLVVIATIREEILDQLDARPITNLDDALTYAGVQQYLASRQDVQRKLNSAGVYTLDCTAKELSMRLANSYFEIKSSGVL